MGRNRIQRRLRAMTSRELKMLERKLKFSAPESPAAQHPEYSVLCRELEAEVHARKTTIGTPIIPIV